MIGVDQVYCCDAVPLHARCPGTFMADGEGPPVRSGSGRMDPGSALCTGSGIDAWGVGVGSAADGSMGIL
ncbi:hypothetical protein Dimus_006593 [Dionaea muscipula]